MAGLGQHDVENGLDLIPAAGGRDLGDRPALQGAQRVLEHAGDQDAGPAAGFVVEPFGPVGRMQHLRVDAGAGGGIAQPEEQRIPPAALGPRGDAGIERRRGPIVGILVGRDVQPGGRFVSYQ